MGNCALVPQPAFASVVAFPESPLPAHAASAQVGTALFAQVGVCAAPLCVYGTRRFLSWPRGARPYLLRAVSQPRQVALTVIHG